MSRKNTLIRKLLQAAHSMVQGGLSETTRRCGVSTCICHQDPARRHGPHLYLTFRKDGKNCALYVPAEYAATARQAQADWARFWEIGCAISEINRTTLQRDWQRSRAKARTGRSASRRDSGD
jgi:hypothetical protein